MNNNVMYNLTYGLFVLTSKVNDKDSGCIINTAGQVTSEPNRISITVNKANYTHDLIMESGKLNISILSEDASFSIFERFGFQSGRDVDKFDKYQFCERSENGIYYITEGVNGFISASVEQTVDLGSHTLFIAKVENMESLSDSPSATYSYYHSHIKPKADNTKTSGKVAWRCKICGYVYEGDVLPDDFVCPLCKHPASDFEKIII